MSRPGSPAEPSTDSRPSELTQVTPNPYSPGMWVNEVVDAVIEVASSRHGYAVFELVGTPYYVQLYLDEELEVEPGGRHLVVEARSNNYLCEDDDLLTDAQEAALERLGWRRPGSRCDSRCGCEDSHGNWFRYADLEGRDETGAPVVGVVLAAFGIYGASEDAEVNVAYDCSSGKKGVASCS
jgi:hypothetical protein